MNGRWLKIGVNSSHELNSYEPVDGKYEYRRIPLEGLKSKYIYIPLSVITDTKLDVRRVAIFSYLKIHCGLNDIVNFTIPDIVEWCGGKPDRRTNGSNDKTLYALDALSDGGYITYLIEKSKSSYMKCKFNDDYYCEDGFATVYLDEIEKIMNYKKHNSKDSTLNNTMILLVFAFLRHKIRRRTNELRPEERYVSNIKSHRERLPEAYSGKIIDMSKEIGIHRQTFSKIIDILEYELCLIVTDRAYRIKGKDDKFRTLPTIFANAYKREYSYSLDVGDDYSRMEIELKAENMKQHYQGYKIDKKKRKTKMEGGNC